ncbi:MAG: ribosome maturation factor RimM [Xanthobacteraceae bacterium]|jgi:16S rRNA processing protein RimM
MNDRPRKSEPSPRRVCLGQFGAAHGVRGELRLRSFTSDPAAIANYGPLEAEDGRVFEITSLRPAKDHFVATLAGIGDRNAAERLANIKLYVPRERLPEPEQADEFYHADLIGLTVVGRAGEKLGTVIAIHNFGAGDLIEVRPDAGGNTELVPFDETHVPAVDVAAGRIVVAPPEGAFAPSPLAGEGGEAKPSRVRGATEKKSLTQTAVGSRRQRSTLSHKGRE